MFVFASVKSLLDRKSSKTEWLLKSLLNKTNNMKRQITLILALILAFSFYSHAQDFQGRLLKDMVKTANGKMILEDFTLITLSNGNTLQVKSHGEAPATGVISRDNFVALFTQTVTSLTDEMTKSDEGATSKDLDGIIGNPDVGVNVYVAKSGVQIEVKTGEEVNRSTVKWEDIFK
jgi:phage tail sheath gpL-like